MNIRCWCNWQSERQSALTLIVVHGLEGSTESQYMLGVARNGLAASMNVVRMNQRNCGGMDHCAPTLYNSGRSGDVAAGVRQGGGGEGGARLSFEGFRSGGVHGLRH